MIAMDHGLCFIRSGEDLSPKLSNLNKVRDTNIYGLFPEFRRRLRQDIIEMSLARLKGLDVSTVEEIVNSVPKECFHPRFQNVTHCVTNSFEPKRTVFS
jgi:hypothetical protein